MNTERNYYELLNIPRDATPEQIRRAFHKIALQHHPDITKKSESNELFLLIKEAYEVLINPQKRQIYDQELQEAQLKPIELKVTYSRPKIPILSEEQLLYVLIEVIPKEAAKLSPPPPINLCLVIDRSTSMQGKRMDTLKAAVIKLLDLLQPEDILALVSFSDRAEVILPADRFTHPKIIQGQIRGIQTSGATEIYQGLEAGINEVRRHASHMTNNHLFLFTDGRTYGDEEQCLRLADAVVQEGIIIHTIGIGEDWNDAFIDQLTSRTGSHAIYIQHPKEIPQELLKKFNSLKNIYADRLLLKLHLNSFVRMRSAFRLNPHPTVILPAERLELGVLPKEDKVSVVLEFIIQALPQDVQSLQIAQGEVWGRPVSSIENDFSLPLSLNLRCGELPAEYQPPEAIYQALARINLYRMQEKAKEEIARHEYEKAQKRLQYLASQLLSSGEYQLAETVLLEIEHLKQTHNISEKGIKKIKYGTRALWLPESTNEEENGG